MGRAQEALMSSVSSSSAIYQELRLNVLEAAGALKEFQENQERVAQTRASTTLAAATAELETMESTLVELNKEMALFAEYQKAGADEFQVQGLVEMYGHTREELTGLIVEQEKLIAPVSYTHLTLPTTPYV